MANLTINLTGDNKSPYEVLKNFAYTTGSLNGRTFTNAYVSTGTGTAAVIYTPSSSTAVLLGSVVYGPASGSDASGLVCCAANGNGYQVLIRTTDVRIFRMTATNTGLTQIATFTVANAVGDVFELERTLATGVMKVRRNGVDIISVTDTTHSGEALRIGFHSRGLNAGVTSFTAKNVASIDSLTSALVPGGAFSGTCTNYLNGSATISVASVSVVVTIAAGAFNGIWPMIADNMAYPRLPASALDTNLTQGANTSFVVRDISLPVGYDTIRDASNNPANFFGLVTADPKYLAKHFLDAGNPLTTNDSWLAPYVMLENPVTHELQKDLQVEQDSAVNALAFTLPRTDGHFLYQGSTGKYFSHSVTLNAAGEIVTPGTGRSIARAIIKSIIKTIIH